MLKEFGFPKENHLATAIKYMVSFPTKGKSRAHLAVICEQSYSSLV